LAFGALSATAPLDRLRPFFEITPGHQLGSGGDAIVAEVSV
jgi:hypothetical protein